MVNSRGDSRLDGLEKANKELNARVQRLDDRISELGSKFDSMLEEMRAGFTALNYKTPASPSDNASSDNHESNSVSAGNKLTFPMLTFDGTDAAAAAAVVSPYPSATRASKNPPDEVPFPKLSVASNGQPPKEYKVSILGETECGLKVFDVFEDSYIGIVPVSAPSSPPLPPPVSRSLFGASSHKPGNPVVHRPHRHIHVYKLEFEPPPDLHLRI